MKQKLKNYLIHLLKKSRYQEGFTLIEMVVVIAIIVILILLIVPNMVQQKQKADEKTTDAFRTTLQTQVELYKADKNDKNPANFGELEKENYLTSDQRKKADTKYEINKEGIVEKK